MDQTFQVIKRHKRLWIIKGDEDIYTPPNFIKIPGRQPLNELAHRFRCANGRYLKAIIEFESLYSPRIKWLGPHDEEWIFIKFRRRAWEDDGN